MSQRLNYFHTIHKAIRRQLFLLSIDLGAANFDSRSEVESLQVRFENLKGYLDRHAAHEDHYFMAFFEQKIPHLTQVFKHEHEAQEVSLGKMAASFEAILKNQDTDNTDAGYRLYLQFNDFTASYCQHLDREETQIMPALWACCTDEELLKPYLSLLSSFTAEDFYETITKFWPAINAKERKMLVTPPSM